MSIQPQRTQIYSVLLTLFFFFICKMGMKIIISMVQSFYNECEAFITMLAHYHSKNRSCYMDGM